MNNLPAEKNRRVLVVDDNRSIHDDLRKILAPSNITGAALDVTETALFGTPTNPSQHTQFEVNSAYQGQEGVVLVKKALAEGRPYAMAFVDMRMPLPGWDGVETAQNIWEIDPDIQIAICTAYSDYSGNEMFEKIGHRDRMVILQKPFDIAEACQLARTPTEKWWLLQQSQRKMKDLQNDAGVTGLPKPHTPATLTHKPGEMPEAMPSGEATHATH